MTIDTLPNILLNTGLLLCLSILAFSCLTLFKKAPQTETEAYKLCQLLTDGLNTYLKRFISSMVQVILYTSIALILFSKIFNHPFYLNQLLAFILGGSIMSASLIFRAISLPKLIPNILEKGKHYLNDACDATNDISSLLSFISSASISLGLLLVIKYGSINALIGYSVGVLFTTFFIRTGGGILKSATSISLDIFKVKDHEYPIDKRNVGKHIEITSNLSSKWFGFESDILSSFVLCITALLLSISSLESASYLSIESANILLILSIGLINSNLIASIIGYIISKLRIKQSKTNNFLLENLYTSIVINGLMLFFLMKTLSIHTPSLCYTYIVGIFTAVLIGFTSEILSSSRFKPTQKLAETIQEGSIVTLLKSSLTGYLSNGLYLIYLALSLSTAIHLSGILGPIILCLGMLSSSASMCAITTFSPIAETLDQIQSLTEEELPILKNTNSMVNIGQSTIAIGNGLVAATNMIATISVFTAIILYTKLPMSQFLSINSHNFIGLLSGILITYPMLGSIMHSLQRLIRKARYEMKRQFQEIPFLLEGKAKPDIIKATDEFCKRSTDALIIPAIILIVPVIGIGYVFESSVLLSFSVGIFLTSIAQSYAWSIMGDSSAQARKYIENGHLGGKESPYFIHSVDSDHLGSVYRDVLSPSLALFSKAIAILTGLILILTN